MMEIPNTDALRIPSARLWLSRRKKVTVMGTMGNTHGVIKAAKPARNATIRSAPKELVPYDASPSKIEGSRIGPRFGRASDGTSVTVALSATDGSSGCTAAGSSLVGTGSWRMADDAPPLILSEKLKSPSYRTQRPSASEQTCPSNVPEMVDASAERILTVCRNCPVFSNILTSQPKVLSYFALSPGARRFPTRLKPVVLSKATVMGIGPQS